jgi:pyridoxamine 5'-phosphate oxidase
MNLAEMREEYMQSGLAEEDLAPDPFDQFEGWFQQALAGKMLEPNAMSLATVSPEGQPSVRTVLLKYFDRDGLVFFTNYESRKARDIEQNPRVSILFPWLELERQVRIDGTASKVSSAESLKYFLSRPHGSQLGAWVSQQSAVVSSRQMLMTKFDELKRKFQAGQVPLPSFWGGYRIVPDTFEFWQGRQSRLHDRLRYTRQEDGSWLIERLAP